MNKLSTFLLKTSLNQFQRNFQSLSKAGHYSVRSFRSRVRPFYRAVLTQNLQKRTAELKPAFSQQQPVGRRFTTMSQEAKKPFERLAKTVNPVNYDIELKPNLKAFTFEGKESISVEVKSATKTVTVNSADIEISSVTYQAEGASAEVTGTVAFQKDDETVTFTFPEELQVGNGSLNVVFTGELNDKMKGFYRSKYTGPDGEDRYGAVTQFEASDARRSFPCWDEPALKATFDITLVVPKNRVALSNMPVKSECDDAKDSNLKVVKYERSPIMSTYLLAYVIGEYDFVEDTDANGVLVRVYTPVGKKEQGRFALDAAVKTLPFYKEYFDIAYPLPKMDLIAIADFAAGAMENWGLVTYRETALLIDPKQSSSKSKQWVALVVGHEIAHQWFGNLVTMEWWTHLWLNEGFASWIEYLSVDNIFKEFDIWTQFVNQDLGRALELDALHTSHPIEVPVGPPSEIDEIFDAISYSKGASVIRMLHDYLGDEAFKKGLAAYLKKFAYKNTFTEDLWEALEAASGKPVGKVMDTWTKQMGFPVIKVSEEQDGNNRVLKLTQEKFNADGVTNEDESKEWLVPVGIATSKTPDAPAQTILMEQPSVTVTMENTTPGDWVKLNSGAVGVFRTNYSSEMLKSLVPAIRGKKLGPRDRLGIQNDLFALCRAGLTSTVDVLNVVEAYITEDNYTVWSDMSMNLSQIAILLQYTDSSDAYKRFAKTLYGPIAKQLGWNANKDEEDNYTVWSDMSMNLSQIAILLQYTDSSDAYKRFAKTLYGPIAKQLGWNANKDEGVLDAMLRDLVLLKLGRYGDEPTVAEARKRFEAHCSGSQEIPADLRATVYTTVLSNGDEATFNQMLKLYDQTDLQEEKVRIARLLGAVKDETLLQKVLDFAMSDKVRSQDTVFVLAGVTSSKEGREIGWKFVMDNWKQLHGRYEGGFLLARMVKSMTENFATEEKALEVEAFFKANPAPAAERSIQQSCENIRLNAKWMANESESVAAFLKNRPAA